MTGEWIEVVKLRNQSNQIKLGSWSFRGMLAAWYSIIGVNRPAGRPTLCAAVPCFHGNPSIRRQAYPSPQRCLVLSQTKSSLMLLMYIILGGKLIKSFPFSMFYTFLIESLQSRECRAQEMWQINMGLLLFHKTDFFYRFICVSADR